MLNALIFDCADCFLDFSNRKPVVASLAVKLLKPVSGELPRAEQEDRHVVTTLPTLVFPLRQLAQWAMPSVSNAERKEQLESLFESSDPLLVHRFELPNEIARSVIAEAVQNERTIPAQIRIALKFWRSSLNQKSA